MVLLPSVVRTGERLLLLLVVRSKPGGLGSKREVGEGSVVCVSGMGTVEEPGMRRNFWWCDVFPCHQEKRRWLRGLHVSEGGRWKSLKQPGEMRAPAPSSQSSVTRCHLSPLCCSPSLSQNWSYWEGLWGGEGVLIADLSAVLLAVQPLWRSIFLFLISFWGSSLEDHRLQMVGDVITSPSGGFGPILLIFTSPLFQC